LDSKSITDLKSATWYSFSRSNEEELMKVISHLPGVYVIRRNEHFDRLVGITDIVYIGRATTGKGKRKGLHRRIRGYLHTTPRRRTSYRVMYWTEKLGGFEIAFIICNTDDEAIEKEIFLLRNFEKEHAELPPFNRQGDKI